MLLVGFAGELNDKIFEVHKPAHFSIINWKSTLIHNKIEMGGIILGHCPICFRSELEGEKLI